MSEHNSNWETGDNYYDIDAISATLLKAIAKTSPLHADIRMKTFKATPAMKLGTALHAKILEVGEYEDLVKVAPSVDRRTKAGKAEYAEWTDALNGDETIITQDQSDAVVQMEHNIRNHDAAVRLLEQCYAYEMYIPFTVNVNGWDMQAKAKIDMVDDEGTIVDIKTTADASPNAFKKQSANLNYHMQMAWYCHAMGFGRKRVWEDANALIIAVENTAPYSVAVYKYDHEALMAGYALCRYACEEWQKYQLAKTLGDKIMPYSGQVIEMGLPAWAANSEKEPYEMD